MSKAGLLFDAIIRAKNFRSDAQLAEEIGIEPANLSRLRHGRRPISEGLVLRVHVITNWEIRDIKGALDLPCRDQVQLQQ